MVHVLLRAARNAQQKMTFEIQAPRTQPRRLREHFTFLIIPDLFIKIKTHRRGRGVEAAQAFSLSTAMA
jgi:hypothetical protein